MHVCVSVCVCVCVCVACVYLAFPRTREVMTHIMLWLSIHRQQSLIVAVVVAVVIAVVMLICVVVAVPIHIQR